MASPVSTKVKTLSAQIEEVKRECDAKTQQLRGRTLSTIEAQTSCMSICQLLKRKMQEITELNGQFPELTAANEEEIFPLMLQMSGLETELSERLKLFQRTLYGYYSFAEVNEGPACVGGRVAPEIETTNPKILELLDQVSCMREIRGDGNCFLYAFATRFLENLVARNELQGFIAFVEAEISLPPELKENVLTLLHAIHGNLDPILQDNKKILPFTSFLRHLAASEMKAQKEIYEHSLSMTIEGDFGVSTAGKKYEDLVDEFVLKMNMDFFHQPITALCQRFEFPVLVIDPELGAPEGFNTLGWTAANATFCRNGNHYFILYTVDEAPRIAPKPRPTEIFINCKVSFGHNLFIRGDGNGLSWNKGKPLVQCGDDTWIYRSSFPLLDMSFKILLDDETWQPGENLKIAQGKLPAASKIDFPLAEISSLFPTTRITVKFDAGQGNQLFIRGNGPGMTWDEGIPLTNVGSDLWVFETQLEFEPFEYKILLNDKQWEDGENHTTQVGKKIEIATKFSNQ